MKLSPLLLLSALSTTTLVSATLEIEVTENTYLSSDCSGPPSGGSTHFPFAASMDFFNDAFPSSLYVGWSDDSGSPALVVQFLLDESSKVVAFQDLYITQQGCYNLTGLYDSESVVGLYFLPLDPADAAVPVNTDVPII